jgi:F-type H+-transporting ATPase subunit beta
MEELSTADRTAVRRARRLVRFLTQPFAVTAQFTGREGASVPLEDTLKGCRAILDGQTDEWAESSLYLVGALDAARAKEGAAQPAVP